MLLNSCCSSRTIKCGSKILVSSASIFNRNIKFVQNLVMSTNNRNHHRKRLNSETSGTSVKLARTDKNAVVGNQLQVNQSKFTPTAVTEVCDFLFTNPQTQLLSTTPMASSEPNELLILETPDKAERDKKSYRVIQLPNGLKALLISDPVPVESNLQNAQSQLTPQPQPVSIDLDSDSSDSTGSISSGGGSSEDEEEGSGTAGGKQQKLAACSLTVDVGSFSDPRDIQGLAHFLEHMIFMGSEKYPDENEFDKYIKTCGGFDNADTNCEETSFYFEVAEECIEGALDRFANLFKNPLMHKEAMTRERKAVESEFKSKLQGDEARREQLLSSLGLDDHPCSIFTWGNLKTLHDNIEDSKLYERVHEFRKHHYSAHRMFVCMQARYPLDYLQEMLVKHFSDIPNNNLLPDDFSRFKNVNPFKDIFSDKVFIVKPVANMLKLDISFPLKTVVWEYKSKPHHFVSYILGHEGEGSLCNYLRQKLYCIELLTGVDDSGFGQNALYSIFTITIVLTQHGLDNVDKILDVTFSYLRFLQNEGPSESLFRELQSIEENSFRYQIERQALENVEELVINLKYYPPKHVLTGSSLYFEYDAAAIQSIFDQINSSKMNIMISTQNEFLNQKFCETEPWFGTEYCTMDFPQKWKDLWKNAKTLTEFKLPEPNAYITTDFNILYDKETSPKLLEYPEKILDNGICEVWYRQDDRFLLPIAYLHFYFISPVVRDGAKNIVLMAVYSMLLKFKLVERLYPATVAGLQYVCFSSDKGLVLKVNGYSQNLHLIVEEFSKSLVNFYEDVNEEQFKIFVEQQIKNYYNTFIKPKSFAKSLRLSVIETNFHPTSEKYEILKTITLDDFKEFAKQFIKELRIEALLQGNLHKDRAENIMQNVLKTLDCKEISDKSLLDLTANKIPNGQHYIRCSSHNESDSNTVTINFYQLGPINIRLNCLLDLLMIIMEEPMFNNLRSQEQLGYDVSCSIRDNYGILGYTIMVNSQEDKFTAEYIDERIEVFRSDFTNVLKQLTSDNFSEYRNSLIKIKSSLDNDLKDEVCRNWAEITTNEYLFDRQKKEIQCILSITLDEFINFYLNHFDAKNNRKFTVQVIGNKEISRPKDDFLENLDDLTMLTKDFSYLKMIDLIDASRGTVIHDIAAFSKSLESYPVTKTKLDEKRQDKI